MRLTIEDLLSGFNATVEANQQKINERNANSKKKIEDAIKSSCGTLKDNFIERDEILKKIDSVLSGEAEAIKNDHAVRKARLSNEQDPEQESINAIVERQVGSLKENTDLAEYMKEKGLDNKGLTQALKDCVPLPLGIDPFVDCDFS